MSIKRYIAQKPPPILGSDKRPSWATGIAVLTSFASNDHNPYYWVSGKSYKKVTSKRKYHAMTIYDSARFKLIDGHWDLLTEPVLRTEPFKYTMLVHATRLEF